MSSLPQEALDGEVRTLEGDDTPEFVEREMVVPLNFDPYAQVVIEEDGDVLWVKSVQPRPSKAVR